MLAALKARIPPTRREWLRAAARGNPFRHERAQAPVRIGELVSPLRYDVLVRRSHFEFVAANRGLFDSDFEAYQRRAREQAYFVWFSRVMIPSWRSHLLDDREGLERAWRERLAASVALHDSFERRGFDTAQPIELLAGGSVQPTPTGKRVSRTIYAGNGNHRLALLMLAGLDELDPSQYRVKRYRSFAPSDTTGLLLERTGAGWTEYRDFIALGYPEVTLELRDGRVHAQGPDPVVAAEVQAIAELDLPHVAKVSA